LKILHHVFSRYTMFLWALLKPLGVWGVFFFSVLDAAAFGLPVDLAVIGYVYQDRRRFLLYVLLASAGSALGSIVIYVIGYKGGEELLRKRIPAARFEKIHAAFDDHPFWSLMLPAMLPPPTPFKLFVLAAAVSEMRFGHFLLAIFSGRVVRFLVLGLLTLEFGLGFVQLLGSLVRAHFGWGMVALGATATFVWILRRRARAAKRSASGEEPSALDSGQAGT
jgi:membrane protein YqaA with SNARE-associated domain